MSCHIGTIIPDLSAYECCENRRPSRHGLYINSRTSRKDITKWTSKGYVNSRSGQRSLDYVYYSSIVQSLYRMISFWHRTCCEWNSCFSLTHICNLRLMLPLPAMHNDSQTYPYDMQHVLWRLSQWFLTLQRLWFLTLPGSVGKQNTGTQLKLMKLIHSSCVSA